MELTSAASRILSNRVILLLPLILLAQLGIAFLILWRTGQISNLPSIFEAMLIAVAVSIALFAVVRQQLRTQIDELRIQTEAMGQVREQLTSQIREAATLEERNRLARELHDSIKQQIFTINVGVAAAQARWEHDQVGAQRALADVRNSTKEAMAEMNALLQQLSPRPLENVGLIQALNQQGEALAYRTGAQVHTEFDDLPPDELLPVGAQESLFRITQEALANIARHARASNVDLKLREQRRDSGSILALEISDNGSGFDQMRVERGMGLNNIRHRAEQLGGRFELTSGPQRGTQLRVWVPLYSQERSAEAVRSVSLIKPAPPMRRSATPGMSVMDQPFLSGLERDRNGYLQLNYLPYWPEIILLSVWAFLLPAATTVVWAVGSALLLFAMLWKSRHMWEALAEMDTRNDFSERTVQRRLYVHHLGRHMVGVMLYWGMHFAFDTFPAGAARSFNTLFAVISATFIIWQLWSSYQLRDRFYHEVSKAVRAEYIERGVGVWLILLISAVIWAVVWVYFDKYLFLPALNGIQWLLGLALVWSGIRFVERLVEFIQAIIWIRGLRVTDRS